MSEIKEQSKLEVAADLLATALEQDANGRAAFRDVLGMTIQDELDKRAEEDGSVKLSNTDIVDVAYAAAEDFVKTIENQND